MNMVESAVVTPLIARENELSCLARAFDEARRGRTTAVFVSGESGVGKTRLATEMTSGIGHDDAILLSGAAIELVEAPPFWPVVDALRKLLRGPAGKWAADLLAPWNEQLDAVLMRPGPRHAHDEPGPGLPIVELLFQVLACLAGQAPLVLLIEDLHWADRSTRDLIVYLLANLIDEPILLLATYRTDGLSAGHPLRFLLPELRRDRRIRFLDLQPLDRSAVRTMVSHAFGEAVNPELTDLVWSRSEGNAFAVEETIRALQDGTGAAVPTTLRELVLNRLERLPLAAAKIVRAVAVAGEPVSHQALAVVVDMPENELIDGLRAAIDAFVLSVDSSSKSYRLRHSLMTEVVSSELFPGERIHLHRRYGETFSRLGDATGARSAARLAHHWEQAGEQARAFAATVEAATDAERLHGFADAYRLWRRALALYGHQEPSAGFPSREEILELAAEAAHLAGEHDEAASCLQDRLSMAPVLAVRDRAVLHHRLGRYLIAGGRSRRAAEAYERAAALLPGDATASDRAALMAGHAEALLAAGRYGRARVQAERALDLIREARAPVEQARLLATLGFSVAYLENPVAGLDAMTQSLRIAEGSGRASDVGQASLHLAELLSGPLNELAEGIEIARSGVERMAELGMGRTYGAALLAVAAKALFRLGRWAEADQAVADGLGRRPTGAQAIELRLARARLLVGRGEIDEAERDLEVIEMLSAEATGPRYRAPLLTLRAGLEMWRGRPDLALRMTIAGLDAVTAESDDIWVIAPLVWHGLRAEADAAALSFTGPTESPTFRRLLDCRKDLARRAASAAPAVRAVVNGYVKLSLAEETRIAGAPDPDIWHECAAIWESHQNPYPTAYAKFREADALLSIRSLAAGAAAALLKAHDIARQLGARPFLEQIEDLAMRARIPIPDRDAALSPAPPDEVIAHPSVDSAVRDKASADVPPCFDRLTAREFDVLGELAEGRTNRQIANRLFISEKTVSVHISHILAKLGVRTRVQAIAVLHRSRQAERVS
jgi:DNA-binding NarL/FixJ family response regulator